MAAAIFKLFGEFSLSLLQGYETQLLQCSRQPAHQIPPRYRKFLEGMHQTWSWWFAKNLAKMY
jgi:hypothetical protein